MTIQDPAPLSRRTFAVRLDRSDLLRTDDGTFLLPVILESKDREASGYARLDMDDAARLHAQLTRHLTSGWAVTEAEKANRQAGEIYQVGGDDRLVQEEK